MTMLLDIFQDEKVEYVLGGQVTDSLINPSLFLALNAICFELGIVVWTNK